MFAAHPDHVFRIAKAYTVHDLKTVYHPGLVLLAGILAVHMPEEDAYALLARLMEQGRMRDLFQSGTPTPPHIPLLPFPLPSHPLSPPCAFEGRSRATCTRARSPERLHFPMPNLGHARYLTPFPHNAADEDALHCIQYQFAHLLHEQMPELGSAAHASGVGPETYLLKWLTSAFAVCMPEPVVFHMFDYIVANAEAHSYGALQVCATLSHGHEADERQLC
jgi:hypothetical protein